MSTFTAFAADNQTEYGEVAIASVQIDLSDLLQDVEEGSTSRAPLPIRIQRSTPVRLSNARIIGTFIVDLTYDGNTGAVMMVHSSGFSSVWTIDLSVYRTIARPHVTRWSFTFTTVTFNVAVDAQLASGPNAGTWVLRSGSANTIIY